MSGYVRLEDALPCTQAPRHDWLNIGRFKAESRRKFECSWCAALATRYWWGWEFKTGEEHFAEAQEEGGNACAEEDARTDRVEVDLEALLGAEAELQGVRVSVPTREPMLPGERVRIVPFWAT
jgi:hypothetical protein